MYFFSQKQVLVIFSNIIILFLLLSNICYGQSKWEWRNPLPQGNHLTSVTYGDNLYVSVGFNGTICTSADGYNWILQTSGTQRNLFSITYGMGLFIATGDSGTIIASSNGKTWTKVTTGTSKALISVSFGNGKFVAAGKGSLAHFFLILSTQSGIVIDNIDSTVTSDGDIDYVTFINNQFIAVGVKYGAVGGSLALFSQDGKTWSEKTTVGGECISCVAFGGNLYVTLSPNIKGEIHISPNLTDWIYNPDARPILKLLNSVTYGDSQFVVVGDSGTILTSKDGIKWDAKASGTTFEKIYSVIYGNNQFVAVGGSSTCEILTSPDGITWTKNISKVSGASLYSVTYADNKFVTVGDSGTILTSSEGTTWSKATSNISSLLLSVTYGNNKFITVGNGGTILTSPDATIWSSATSNTSSILLSVAYGDHKFVAVGSGGAVLTSPEGTTWSKATSGTSSHLFSVTYGNNKFVAVGSGGTILTSINDTSWTLCSNLGDQGSTTGLNSVIYAKDEFVAVGSVMWEMQTHGLSCIYTSPDGITWTQQQPWELDALNSITFSGNLFQAVGTGGTILKSFDGKNWEKESFVKTNDLNSITDNNNQIIAVGDGGIILSSMVDNPESVLKVNIKSNQIDKIRIAITNKYIYADLPCTLIGNHFKVSLFAVGGKLMYSSIIKENIRSLTIPKMGIPAGIYIMIITNGSKFNLSTSFVLMR